MNGLFKGCVEIKCTYKALETIFICMFHLLLQSCEAILHTAVSGAMMFGKRSNPVCKLCCQHDYCNYELCDLHSKNFQVFDRYQI